MTVSVEKLEQLILDNLQKYDTATIVSGFFSADVLKDIAQIGNPITFYYGMYPWNQITELQYQAFQRLESSYPNININIVVDYHVHTKCYMFKSLTGATALVGSANCSSNGLLSEKNCEMLVEIADASLIRDLDAYTADIAKASVHYDDPSIVPAKRKPTSKNKVATTKGRIYSGNPFIDNIPLYVYNTNGKKEVPKKSGINWGLQSGNTSKSGYVEAYIPIKNFDLKYYAAMFPPCGMPGSGSGGKITRRLSPVTVTWDDGTVMQMLFQATQDYPGNHKNGQPFLVYPKQLTANSGGAELGEYLRKRMGVPARKMVTMADFKKYGRDYITLTYISPGNYEADFQP